ncbi:ferritin-like domain-containing protein [Spirosoma pulveris]
MKQQLAPLVDTVTPENRGEALQQAIEIEIATIPVYLYTYYSINRETNQDTIIGVLTNVLLNAGKNPQQASVMALDYSAKMMEAPQLVPGRGYYAQNNIDTVYYDKKHRPHFVNGDDSGDLIQVVDRQSAIAAINLIVEQGEEHTGATPLNSDGSVDCTTIEPADFDDPDHQELLHFEKFARIYCHYEHLVTEFTALGISKNEFNQFFILNLPANPKAADKATTPVCASACTASSVRWPMPWVKSYSNRLPINTSKPIRRRATH